MRPHREGPTIVGGVSEVILTVLYDKRKRVTFWVTPTIVGGVSEVILTVLYDKRKRVTFWVTPVFPCFGNAPPQAGGDIGAQRRNPPERRSVVAGYRSTATKSLGEKICRCWISERSDEIPLERRMPLQGYRSAASSILHFLADIGKKILIFTSDINAFCR